MTVELAIQKTRWSFERQCALARANDNGGTWWQCAVDSPAFAEREFREGRAAGMAYRVVGGLFVNHQGIALIQIRGPRDHLLDGVLAELGIKLKRIVPYLNIHRFSCAEIEFILSV